MTLKRLGFFTRHLDDVPAGERYRLAMEQIIHAERMGLSSAWVAQHHFDADEGGLPSPFVFLAQVAARTRTIRLGTGVVTLPLENPIRVAEDAAVLDLMSGGRLELGVGTGGNPSAFAAFGHTNEARGEIYASYYKTFRGALRGQEINGSSNVMYPAHAALDARIWQATFSVEGGRRAGLAGDGLLLSRTQPRSPDAPKATLPQIQDPIVDAYYAALPAGATPRILGSRSIFVADNRAEARRYAEQGLGRFIRRISKLGRAVPTGSLDDIIATFDVHMGTVDEVIESLSRDTTLNRVTDVAGQVHSVDPPHPLILRSIELFATKVAPAMGWVKQDALASA
jgi:putative FMN-dependent luciferase-like monooxygenase